MMINKVTNFIESTLFTRIETRKVDVPKTLPSYFDLDYEVYAASINTVKCLIVLSLYDHIKLKLLRKRLTLLSDALNNDEPIIFVANNLDWYMISKLMQNGISFVIPDRQIYLPFLACSLNLKFDPVGIKRKQFSPATQYILIEFINMKKNKYELSDFDGLELSKMSVSRALKELVGLELIQKNKNGNRAFWTIEIDRKKLWDLSKSYLFNPVTDTESVKKIDSNSNESLIIAGELALSNMSLMSTPDREVLAISNINFKQSKSLYNNVSIHDNNGVNLQIWKHPIPTYIGKIHPLALYASFIGEHDDRINECLDDIIDNYWKEI